MLFTSDIAFTGSWLCVSGPIYVRQVDVVGWLSPSAGRCPDYSSGDLIIGCTCHYGGTVNITTTWPYYVSTCSASEAGRRLLGQANLQRSRKHDHRRLNIFFFLRRLHATDTVKHGVYIHSPGKLYLGGSNLSTSNNTELTIEASQVHVTGTHFRSQQRHNLSTTKG